jgi:hypothetical protein
MSGFKFNIDPAPPKEEKIAEHRNFGEVLHNYQRMTNPLYKTPLYRYRRVFLSLVLVLVVAWLISEYGNDERMEQEKRAADSVHRADSLSKIEKR